MFNRSKFVSCYVVFAIYRFIDRGPTCAVLAVSTAIALPLCGKLEECVSWKTQRAGCTQSCINKTNLLSVSRRERRKFRSR